MSHGIYFHLSGSWYNSLIVPGLPGDQTVCDTELHVNMCEGVFIHGESGDPNETIKNSVSEPGEVLLIGGPRGADQVPCLLGHSHIEVAALQRPSINAFPSIFHTMLLLESQQDPPEE